MMVNQRGIHTWSISNPNCISTVVVYDCPERDSEISSRSSTPGRDGSVTPLGMGEEACNVVDDDDFTGIEVGRIDIYE